MVLILKICLWVYRKRQNAKKRTSFTELIGWQNWTLSSNRMVSKFSLFDLSAFSKLVESFEASILLFYHIADTLTRITYTSGRGFFAFFFHFHFQNFFKSQRYKGLSYVDKRTCMQMRYIRFFTRKKERIRGSREDVKSQHSELFSEKVWKRTITGGKRCFHQRSENMRYPFLSGNEKSHFYLLEVCICVIA